MANIKKQLFDSSRFGLLSVSLSYLSIDKRKVNERHPVMEKVFVYRMTGFLTVPDRARCGATMWSLGSTWSTKRSIGKTNSREW